MVDVTVRGAGIFGLSVAWVCARRGARVQVIDPHGPGAGASGGIVGALAPHVPENWNPKKQFQLDSLLMAQAFWAEVEAVGGGDAGYARLGRVQPIADDQQLARARMRCDTSETLWDGAATWAVRRADDLKHWTPPSASGWVICDTLSARVHPRRACAALSAGLAVLGAPVQPDGTERGVVVEATGAAGLQTLSARMGRPVGTAVKGQAALLAFAAPQAPQVFVDGLHLVPHGDGTLAVGSTSERTFEEATTVDAQLDDVLHRARAAMPVLQDAPVLERWAGLRPRAKSRAPILGPHPLDPGRYIANGGFKIGFGMAPKAAEALADLILENRDTIPADFRPETCL